MKAILKLIPIISPQEGKIIVFVRGDHKEVVMLNKIKTGEKIDYKYWIGWNGTSVEWTNDISELYEIICEYKVTMGALQATQGVPLRQDENEWRYALKKIGHEVDINDNPVMHCYIDKKETWEDVFGEFYLQTKEENLMTWLMNRYNPPVKK